MNRFSVKQTQAGFSFNLVADNGRIVATSQVYTTKAACFKGIESVQANAPLAPVEDQTAKGFEAKKCPKFELYNDRACKYRFRLRAGNGEIIAVSQGYRAKSSCVKGIDSVRVNTVTTVIEEAMSELKNGTVSGAPDYSQESCWVQFPKITKDVDTFYIYSTVYVDSSFEEGASDYATLDNPEMFLGALGEYVTNTSVYEESTNVFVPFYRQSGMKYAGEISKKTGSLDAALSGISYQDIKAALDYYFENCNNGRPFIIAGHSQGSAMLRYVLKNYFKEHPEYYERMIVAYAIGYSITKEDLEAYPYLKFATGESDTGVIVSWSTEGPKNVEENAANGVVLPNAMSINPLNWKLDETYAPASENLGSLILNEETGEYEITDVGADAQVVPSRGVIVTNTTFNQYAAAEFFGPQSFHEDDYTLYYNNLKANVAKRIAAYLASK